MEHSASVAAPKQFSRKTILITLTGLTIAILVRDQLVAALAFTLEHLLLIAPLIVLGVLVTAGLTASGSISLLVSTFAGNQMKMILLVSFVGSLTPVCGITVLPLIAGLLAARVALAPIMAFLLSSPITSPEMMAITAGTLGLPFAIGKSVAAFCIGVFGGAVTLLLVQAGQFANPVKNETTLPRIAGSAACCGPNEVNWTFWRDAQRMEAFRQTPLRPVD